MNLRTLAQIFFSLSLGMQWCLPVKSQTSETMTIDVEVKKPLNLNLPASFRAGYRYRETYELGPSRESNQRSEIGSINSKAPLITVPMEFDQSDLLLGGLAATAIVAITVTDTEIKILKHFQSKKNYQI